MRTTIALLALLLAVSACGDGAEASGETLEDFFGWGVEAADPAAQEAEWADQHRRMEEHVAACMAEQGFEYVPQELNFGGTVSHPRNELSEEEFREEYGYGISTVSFDDDAMMAADEFEDPNWDIVSRMDPAEQDAYYAALHGEMPQFDPDDPDAAFEWEMGGCYGDAERETFGQRQEVWEELGPLFEDLYERMQADPRIADAQAAWSACMADAGYAFGDESDIWEHLSERMNELYMASEPDWDAMDPDEMDSWRPELDPDRLAELQAEVLVGAREQVQAELESAFIDEHRELLEQAREAM